MSFDQNSMSMTTSTGLDNTHKATTPSSSNPFHQLAGRILVLLAIVIMGASWWAFFQPHPTLQRHLDGRLPGMTIVGWEIQGSDTLRVGVVSRRGWDRSPNGPVYEEERVSAATFIYPMGDGSAEHAQHLLMQLDTDVGLLSQGARPSSFEGFHSASPLALAGQSNSGSIWLFTLMVSTLMVVMLVAFHFNKKHNTHNSPLTVFISLHILLTGAISWLSHFTAGAPLPFVIG